MHTCTLLLLALASVTAEEMGTDTLRSLHKRVTSSSQHPQTAAFAVSHAVDGSTSTVSGCNCCAATQQQNQPWIQIDMGRRYRIRRLHVIGRTDVIDVFRGMHLYIHNTPSSWKQQYTGRVTIPTLAGNSYSSVLSDRPIGRYVTLQLPGNNVLLCVCEVNIYSRDCRPGTYGPKCDKTCGFCQQGEVCDHVTGTCTQCQAGYRRNICKETCTAGKFGQDCTSHCHCKANRACDHVTGECPDGRCDLGWQGWNCSEGCKPGTYGENCNLTCGNCNNNVACNTRTGECALCANGFTGQLCTDECPAGTFGFNCLSECHCKGNRTCDRGNGTCPNNACGIGWMGVNCSKECNTGTYGVNCSETCGNCIGNEKCDHVTGRCTLCEAGYKGDICKENCTAGSYGYNCTSVCHCHENRTCNHETGVCPGNWCETGWQGGNCADECDYGKYGENCTLDCNCTHEEDCNKKTGICISCWSGFTGQKCELECKAGSFGLNCSFSCHCYNESNCDHVNGSCPNDKCDLGWIGKNCSQECEYGRYGDRCEGTCGHCYGNGTCDRRYGRCKSCSSGYTGGQCKEECASGTYGQDCRSTCGNCYENATCDRMTGKCSSCASGYTGQLCVEDCPFGTFGLNCSSTCHCRNKQTCNHLNGTCPGNLCDNGWDGHSCSQECEPGTFGGNCRNTCGHCFQNKTCDIRSGLCISCSAGYTGDLCKEECPPGKYGLNCSMTCGHCVGDCDPINGYCSGDCQPGYRGSFCYDSCQNGSYGSNCDSACGHCINNETCTIFDGTCVNGCQEDYYGDQCHNECPIGMYGELCNITCGFCRDNKTCNFETGSCDECQDGYMGLLCKDRCGYGFYGNNCSSECGQCAANVTCNNTNGRCEEGCGTGYNGELCTQAVRAHPLESSSGAAGAIVGSILAIICVAVIALVVVSRLRRWNKSPRDYFSVVVKYARRIRYMKGWKRIVTINSEPETEPTYARVTPTIGQPFIHVEDQIGRREYNSYFPDAIPIYSLWDYIHQDEAQNNERMLSEFMILSTCPTYEATVGNCEQNLRKNRYRGFSAYDHSRVHLPMTDFPASDYINANFIEGFGKHNKFIAVQGPTNAMVDHFWLMISQQECQQIVMLTNVFELGVRKCLQYWPDEGEITYGDVTVTLQNTEEYTDYVIRHFEINQATRPSQSVSQYHFRSWPDKDVPDNVWCLVNFWRAVDSMASTSTTPVVVHCSAGIGRTGTFIALDNAFHQAMSSGTVNPYEVVKRLRTQRIKMVQTPDQYLYLHDVVAEALLVGPRSIHHTRFDELYTFMDTLESDGISRHTKQFQLIEDSLEGLSAGIQEESEYSNVAFNFDDGGRVHLQMDWSKPTSTVEASYLPLVTWPNGCLIARSPGPEDVDELWDLVNQTRVRTVVMATSPTHPHYQTSLNLGISDIQSFGELTIQRVTSAEEPNIMTFTINDEREVKQFQIPGCTGESDVPCDPRDVAEVMDSIIMWQAEGQAAVPILVHCGDGGSISGLVAVILNEVLRMEHQDGAINILESVKTMKQVNKNIITSVGQLKFCYDAVWAYLHKDDVYQNI